MEQGTMPLTAKDALKMWDGRRGCAGIPGSRPLRSGKPKSLGLPSR